MERADISDFKQEELNNYIDLIKKSKPNLAKFSDEKILALSGIIDSKTNKPTVAGTFLFAEFPQAYFPQIYDDRIQIISPGSLYGEIKESDLGTEKMLEARNKTIVRILEETTDLVENRHTGIETMREEMKNMNLQEPEFIADNKDFTVIFRKENKNDVIQNYTENCTENEIKLIKILKENPSLTQLELSKNLNLSRRTIATLLANLKEKGKIERQGSDKKGYWKVKE